ncbi:ATP-binding protein [bacterium]|nr:ATP-binding protein [bacterium]MDB4810124.1 ATP-binding protein [bacterium]MDC0278671.1 ATP-binding protein [bacterium]
MRPKKDGRKIAGNFTAIKRAAKKKQSVLAQPVQSNAKRADPSVESDDTTMAPPKSGGSPPIPPSKESFLSSKDSTPRDQVEPSWKKILNTLEAFDAELREAFVEDASECANTLEHFLLNSKSNDVTSVQTRGICRELHNLKGASASVGLDELSSLLHQLEESFSSPGASPGKQEFSALFETVDQIRKFAATPNSPPTVPQHQEPDLNNSQTASGGTAAKTDQEGFVRIRVNQLNRLMDMLAQLVMLRNRRETELEPLQSVQQELSGTAAKIREVSLSLQDSQNTHQAALTSEIASDLTELANEIQQSTRPLIDGNVAVSSFLRNFRSELTSLRRGPLRDLARHLHRAAHDTAAREGKVVNFTFEGEDERLETDLQHKLQDSLLHIVRNAVCHGIERPEYRLKNGKSNVGAVTIQVSKTPEALEFVIRDDGQGLDLDSIKAKAIALGMIQSDRTITSEQLSRLILKPGFTTRRNVNEVAGRGIGMDVVASNIDRMRGWVDIDSTPTIGTTIRLHVPLPSIIQHVLVVRTAGQLFGVPMNSIRSTGSPSEPCQTLVLGEIIDPQCRNANQHVFLDLYGTDTPETGSINAHLTLAVEEIIGPEELVVRPMPEMLKRHPYINGVTLSGQGETVLLVSPRDLIETHRTALSQNTNDLDDDQTRSETSVQNNYSTRSDPARVLLYSDSITVRKRIRECLKRYDFTVLEAIMPKEAESLLSDHSFQLVIFDQSMRIGNLFDRNRFEQNQTKPEQCLFICTGKSKHAEKFTHNLKSYQFTDITKPIRDETFDAAINQLTAREDNPLKNYPLLREEPNHA